MGMPSRSSFMDEASATRLAQRMAYAGVRSRDLMPCLVAAGVHRGMAAFLIHQKIPELRLPWRRTGIGNMVLGGFSLLTGLGAAAFSYLLEENLDRWAFAMTFGAILLGAAWCLRGIHLLPGR